MLLRADFDQPALVTPDDEDWVHSPESGVDRRMLDRIGDEVARATSIVRYAPQSAFPCHEHALGEEFLVLDGIFADDDGDYPPGTYVRNPPGSGHAPRSENGCLLFVKLRQFDPQDLVRIVVDTNAEADWQPADDGDGTKLPLHRHGTELVFMRGLAAGEAMRGKVPDGGMETLVVRGVLGYAGQSLPPQSWLRLPAGASYEFVAAEDARIWIKTGHLPIRD